MFAITTLAALAMVTSIFAYSTAYKAQEREKQKDGELRVIKAENASLKMQVEILTQVLSETHPNELARALLAHTPTGQVRVASA